MSGEIITLLFGRSLTGFCASILNPTYLAEISSPEYRGLFADSVTIAIAFCVLLTRSLAVNVNWSVNAIIWGLFPLLSYVRITFAPESPSWLLKKNRLQGAYESFVWFRGSNENSMKEFKSMIESRPNLSEQQKSEFNESILLTTKCKATNNIISWYQNLLEKMHELRTEKSFNRPWLSTISIYYKLQRFNFSVTQRWFFTLRLYSENQSTGIKL